MLRNRFRLLGCRQCFSLSVIPSPIARRSVLETPAAKFRLAWKASAFDIGRCCEIRPSQSQDHHRAVHGHHRRLRPRRKDVDGLLHGMGGSELRNRARAPGSCTGKRIGVSDVPRPPKQQDGGSDGRSEEHTSELQSLMRISYAVFCLKKKNYNNYSTTLTRPYPIA